MAHRSPPLNLEVSTGGPAASVTLADGVTDVLTGCIVQEELNWGCAGIGNLVTSGGFFARPVVEVGTPELQQRWLAPLCTETPPLTALASTEPASALTRRR